MTETNKTYFRLLKEVISRTFLTANSGPKKMADWKGETIVLFQEDLRAKTQGSISEKSFYNYFKKSPEKLPRVDVLNMLSLYAGHTNWEDFKNAHSELIVEPVLKKKKSKVSNLSLGVILLLVAMVAFYYFQRDNTFSFCLVDEDEQTPLTSQIRIEILKPYESSVFLQTDDKGCFTYHNPNDAIHFVVQSPYYKTDTILRSTKENQSSIVPMRKDDYALMLKYYSDGNLTDIKKRREQLTNLISTKAQIYQSFPNVTGIELYTKEEFINKMTIPTSALKNMHILDKEFANGKITKLKFIIK